MKQRKCEVPKDAAKTLNYPQYIMLNLSCNVKTHSIWSSFDIMVVTILFSIIVSDDSKMTFPNHYFLHNYDVLNILTSMYCYSLLKYTGYNDLEKQA